MPKTAAFIRSLGGTLPGEMSNMQLIKALDTLRVDLPGDPIGYLDRVAPVGKRCECGALHLRLDDPALDTATRSSLHRLLATPFGNLVSESMRRKHGLTAVRFGWDGLGEYAPLFMAAITSRGSQTVAAEAISDADLHDIMAALGKDMPGMMGMLDHSLRTLSVHAVGSRPGDTGRQEWKSLIDQVMLAFSTPVRKYVDEYALREYNGARVGAVNCCIIMAAKADQPTWQRRWFDEQVSQQLTPDC